MIKNCIKFSMFMLMIMNCAQANIMLGQDIARLAKKENYKTDDLPKYDAPQEAWDLFVEKIGEQYIHRAQRGDTPLSLRLERYHYLKALKILGNKIAELAKTQGYQLKDVPEGEVSQETWDAFVEKVSAQSMQSMGIEKNPFNPIFEKYSKIKKDINSVNELEKKNNEKLKILGNKIAKLAKTQGYQLKDVPEGEASQETWDAFIKKVSDQSIEKNLFDPLFEEYSNLKKRINLVNKAKESNNLPLKRLGNKIAEVAKKEGYELKDVPEGEVSQETWDAFIKKVSDQSIEKNPFDPLFEEYSNLKKRINKINELEKKNNEAKNIETENNNEISEIVQEWIEEYGKETFKHWMEVQSLENLIELTDDNIKKYPNKGLYKVYLPYFKSLSSTFKNACKKPSEQTECAQKMERQVCSELKANGRINCEYILKNFIFNTNEALLGKINILPPKMKKVKIMTKEQADALINTVPGALPPGVEKILEEQKKKSSKNIVPSTLPSKVEGIFEKHIKKSS
jgi:hypothetical protein